MNKGMQIQASPITPQKGASPSDNDSVFDEISGTPESGEEVLILADSPLKTKKRARKTKAERAQSQREKRRRKKARKAAARAERKAQKAQRRFFGYTSNAKCRREERKESERRRTFPRVYGEDEGAILEEGEKIGGMPDLVDLEPIKVELKMNHDVAEAQVAEVVEEAEEEEEEEAEEQIVQESDCLFDYGEEGKNEIFWQLGPVSFLHYWKKLMGAMIQLQNWAQNEEIFERIFSVSVDYCALVVEVKLEKKSEKRIEEIEEIEEMEKTEEMEEIKEIEEPKIEVATKSKRARRHQRKRQARKDRKEAWRRRRGLKN